MVQNQNKAKETPLSEKEIESLIVSNLDTQERLFNKKIKRKVERLKEEKKKDKYTDNSEDLIEKYGIKSLGGGQYREGFLTALHLFGYLSKKSKERIDKIFGEFK